MDIIKVVCIYENKCLNKESLMCKSCTRNLNRLRHEDKFKSSGNWYLDEIKSLRKKIKEQEREKLK